ncbi:MAG: response regulator transcription factor [Lachnospiraceae bacterium]|nr:response regulator transcription factor [Lachnospiraceae bacterium]
MIIIGICDDELRSREHLKRICQAYFMNEKSEYRIEEFISGEEALAYDGDKMHLLFLDIEMPGIDGIQVMHSLEKSNKVWRVVFVSSHQNMVFETLGVKTLGFGVKPVRAEQVEKWIRIAEKENEGDIVLECIIGQNKVFKRIDEIYYWQAEGNYTYLVEQGKKSLANQNLKAWQKRLTEMSVVRVHKSYLVNMNHVKYWGTEQVCLTNGAKLAVGRLYQKEAREKYYDYVQRMALGRV